MERSFSASGLRREKVMIITQDSDSNAATLLSCKTNGKTGGTGTEGYLFEKSQEDIEVIPYDESNADKCVLNNALPSELEYDGQQVEVTFSGGVLYGNDVVTDATDEYKGATAKTNSKAEVETISCSTYSDTVSSNEGVLNDKGMVSSGKDGEDEWAPNSVRSQKRWRYVIAIVIFFFMIGAIGFMVYSAIDGKGRLNSATADQGQSISHSDNDTITINESVLVPDEDGDLFSSSAAPKYDRIADQGGIVIYPTGFSSIYSPTSLPSFLPTSHLSNSPSKQPTPSPTGPRTYVPGDLSKTENGLLLSTGLSSRIIARSGAPVEFTTSEGNDGKVNNKSKSTSLFHERPDAAAVFSLPDGRWVYASNSEVVDGGGGVGSLFFDANGGTADYKIVLSGTSKNCGGGRSPWGTWITCEENGDGKIFEVDPTGRRAPKRTVLGQDGGNFESFSFDFRNPDVPRFFYTEDKNDGALRRYTPHPDAVASFVKNGKEAFNLLHARNGTFESLVFDVVGKDAGTFRWSTDLSEGRQSAQDNYINTEGIDVRNGMLVFVSKKQKELFILTLDEGTWMKSSTENGIFDGQPDQVNYLLEDNEGRKLISSKRPPMMFFTEEGGKRAGVHARDSDGRYLTIVESLGNWAETTGLAFSPDYRHMYFAFQEEGLLFDVSRDDGYAFDANVLDVKYHFVSDLVPSSTD